MQRPTIREDGRPLTAQERKQRHREKKQREAAAAEAKRLRKNEKSRRWYHRKKALKQQQQQENLPQQNTFHAVHSSTYGDYFGLQSPDYKQQLARRGSLEGSLSE